jgi:hypothetical protein
MCMCILEKKKGIKKEKLYNNQLKFESILQDPEREKELVIN